MRFQTSPFTHADRHSCRRSPIYLPYAIKIYIVSIAPHLSCSHFLCRLIFAPCIASLPRCGRRMRATGSFMCRYFLGDVLTNGPSFGRSSRECDEPRVAPTVVSARIYCSLGVLGGSQWVFLHWLVRFLATRQLLLLLHFLNLVKGALVDSLDSKPLKGAELHFCYL